MFGANQGGGVLAAPGSDPGGGGYPFTRWARLTAMCERLRADDWPIANSLQERSEADPKNISVLDMVPAPGLLEAGFRASSDGEGYAGNPAYLDGEDGDDADY